MYQASVLAPRTTKDSPRDAWGNVKIPLIEFYKNDTRPDADGWFSVTEHSANRYASLMGVPIQLNSSNFIDHRFNTSSPYLYLNCPVRRKVPLSKRWTQTPYNATGVNSIISYVVDVANITVRSLDNLENLKPVDLTYFDGLEELQCNITTTYVEVEVFCPTSSTCAVNKLRRSKLPHPPPAYTALDELDWTGHNYWRTFNQLFLTSWSDALRVGTPQEGHLYKPYTPSLSPLDSILNISSQVSGTRFGQLFNAYWTSMQNHDYLMTLDDFHPEQTLHTVYDENEKPENLSVNRLEALLDSNYTFYNSTRAWRMNGTASRHADIIVAHKGWVVTPGIASIVLLLISLIPPTARQLCNGPPLEVNLSSLLTRHNPYISLSSTGTSVEADDRARWLKDLRVQFGDVESQANIGSLAIGTPVRGERNVERVHEGRLYE
jgi:hypothetical protein